jgi:hypothetical protein
MSAVNDRNFSQRRKHGCTTSMSGIERRNDGEESTEVSIASGGRQDRTIGSPIKFSDLTTLLGYFYFVLSALFPVGRVEELNSALGSYSDLTHGDVYS